MVKKSNETVEDIMKQQLSLLENSDKVVKLERESARDKKIIQELKEREKVSARALVLFERKLKFLKESIISEMLKVCKISEEIKETEDIEIIDEVCDRLYALCNKLEEATSISERDRAFILNKQISGDKEDTQSRFDRLKADFNQKIGSSVLRKPGRPKKEEQSIVADIGLGKKVERVVDEETETKNRLNEIFYGAPSAKVSTVSTIPQTEDSTFDFAEALNPNHSLQDIMSDIMSDLSSDTITTYSKENLDAQISRLDENEIADLESGVISKLHLHESNNNDIVVDEMKKSVHKNGILTENRIFDSIRR